LILKSDATFGLFIIFATFLEMQEKRNPPYKYVKIIEKSKKSIFNILRWNFIARFEQKELQKAREEMERLGLNAIQKDFILSWLQKEIDFVKKTSAIKIP